MRDAEGGRSRGLSALVERVNEGVVWIKRHERPVLIAGVAFQVVVLLALIGLHSMPFFAGETILLRVVPVDPRDLLRGEYVQLAYEFSSIPAEEIERPPGDSFTHDDLRGRTVYVSLVPEADGNHWRHGKVSVERPSSGKYIRGRIADQGRLEFGIESFYLEEGRGLEYEKAIRDKHLSAAIALTRDGKAALRELIIEDPE